MHLERLLAQFSPFRVPQSGPGEVGALTESGTLAAKTAGRAARRCGAPQEGGVRRVAPRKVSGEGIGLTATEEPHRARTQSM